MENYPFEEPKQLSEAEKKELLDKLKNEKIEIESVRSDGKDYISVEGLKMGIGLAFAAGKLQGLPPEALSSYVLINVKNMIEQIEKQSASACLECPDAASCKDKNCTKFN